MDIQLQNQLKRLVEVTALLGLSLHAHREAKVVSELEKFAFPNELAEKINKRVEGICCVVNCLNTHKQTEMVESGTGQTIICVECLEQK